MNVLKRLFKRHDPESHAIRNDLAVTKGKSELTSRRIERMARREILQLQLENIRRERAR